MIEIKQYPLYRSNARTLSPKVLGQNDSGWFISGEIHEDYYKWVSDFVAIHPTFGCVRGNFQSIVYADSQEAYDDFCTAHPFDSWDYQDI